MRVVVGLASGWALWTDDKAEPLLVHSDGRRLEPRAAAQEGCAQELYVSLKLAEDKLARTQDGHERNPDFYTIWSARAVLGHFILKVKEDQRVLRQRPEKRSAVGFEETDEEVAMEDLSGNPVEGAPWMSGDEDPQEFLDKELDAFAKVQQEERAKLWTPGN